MKVFLVSIVALCCMIDTESPAAPELPLENQIDIVNNTGSFCGVGYSWAHRGLEIERQGVELGSFAKQVLEDTSYREHWNNALYARITDLYLHHEKDYTPLLQDIIRIIEIGDDEVSYQKIENSLSALYAFRAILQPSIKDDPELLEAIEDTFTTLFGDENPARITYWEKRFQLDQIGSDVADESRRDIWYKNATRTAINIIIFLDFATDNPRYSAYLDFSDEDTHTYVEVKIDRLMEYYDKQHWEQGRYSMFKNYERDHTVTINHARQQRLTRVLQWGLDRLFGKFND